MMNNPSNRLHILALTQQTLHNKLIDVGIGLMILESGLANTTNKFH